MSDNLSTPADPQQEIAALKESYRLLKEENDKNAIAFAEWIAFGEGEYKLTLVDNDWYWDSDKDGDQPLTTEYLYELFKRPPSK